MNTNWNNEIEKYDLMAGEVTPKTMRVMPVKDAQAVLAAALKEQLEEVQKRCPVIEDIKKVGDSLWVKIPAENDTQTFQILSQNVISSLLSDKS